MAQIFYGQITTESILIFMLLMFGTYVIGSLIHMILRILTRDRLTPALSKALSRIATYAIYALALYIGISKILGLNLSTLVAALGIAGILIAISSQQILQNIFAGIILALERPVKIGDWVEVGGSPQAGISRVRDITLLRTVLRSNNGSIVVVSNSTLIGSNIINYTQGEFLRIPIKLTVPITANLEEIKSVILDVCKEHEKILPNVPKKEKPIIMKFIKIPTLKKILERPTEYSRFQPVVNIKDITETGIVLEILVWIWEVNNKEYIVSDFLSRVLNEFKKSHIKLS